MKPHSLKLNKQIEVGIGCCSQRLLWVVGENHAQLIGVHPNIQIRNIWEDTFQGEIYAKILLDFLGEKVFSN